MRPALLGVQCREGNAKGSWDAREAPASSTGRIETTAFHALCLEVSARYGRRAAEK